METYTLGVALVALGVALTALLGRQRGRDHRCCSTVMGATGRPGPSPSRRASLVVLAPGAPRPVAELGRAEWWLAVIPTACAVIAGTLVVVIFAAQNLEPVSVRLLDWELPGLPLAVIVFASSALTGVAVTIPARLRRQALRTRIDWLERRLRQSEEPERLPASFIIGPRAGRRSPNAGSRRPA